MNGSTKFNKLSDVVLKDEYEALIRGMLKSSDVRVLYDKYIIKDISFEKWVRGRVDHMLVGTPYVYRL